MKISKEECTMKRWGDIDIPDGTLYIFEEIEGCNFPFQLYIPFDMNDNPDIILASRTPDLNPKLTFDEMIIDAAYGYNPNKKKKVLKGPNPVGRFLSYNLGNICLMPVIPRAVGIEAPYLSYKVYNNIFDEAYDAIDENRSGISKDDVEKFRDLHLQVVRMIEVAVEYLKEQNINVDDKVILSGYSAAAKFSMFFSALHPELVKAVVVGGTGGNNMIPDASLNLNYPLGVSDIPGFDYETFKQIPQFYYIGEIDYNDLTKFKTKYELLPENERIEGKSPYVKDVSGNKIPRRNDGIKGYHDEVRDGKVVHIQEDIPFDKLDFELDENGEYQMAYDGGYYTLEQVKYIVKNIGSNPQVRFDKMKQYYDELGINSIFKKYPGDHQSVFNSEEIFEDIEKFYDSIHNSKNNALK